MKYSSIIALALIFNTICMAQEKNEDLPYYEVPEYYSEYTVGTVTARMIDGLGFRFRWATEELRGEDYIYKVNEDGRTIEETVNHVLGLSRVILNSALKKPTDSTVELSLIHI